jgi:abequosyltransferase
MDQPLLTIAIPTFNRADLLDKCLNAALLQIDNDLKNLIEIIVFDNNSNDHTSDIVTKHIDRGFAINYTKNTENIGADKNIASCYLNAKGRYVWVFSDDDFILPGYLKQIVDLLSNNQFGVIYLNSVWYNEVYDGNSATPSLINYMVYDDPNRYVNKVNYWCTFLSGNIINKSLSNNAVNITDFYDTSLVQLSWILPVIFAGAKNAVINSQVIACKADNTGVYNLFKVFGTNFNAILDRLIEKNVVSKSIKKIINRHLLKSFFPMFINKQEGKIEKNNALKIMIPIYWNYPAFWSKVFPAVVKNRSQKNVSSK